jgi:hypothetical protein
MAAPNCEFRAALVHLSQQQKNKTGTEMAKPQDFYVGVLDIFSILLPGAVVTWTAWVWLSQAPFENAITSNTAFVPQKESGQWVAFLLSAYAVGHIVFMVASQVDRTFNWFRKYVLRRLKSDYDITVEKNALEAVTALRFASVSAAPIPGLTSPPTESAKAWASKIVGRAIEPRIPEMTNNYQWSRAFLRLRAPAALAEVLRIEADSKFFRSLFIVFVFLAVYCLVNLWGSDKLPLRLSLFLVLAALSFWRYAERREKGIEEAYRSAIVYFTISDVSEDSASADRSG